MNAPGQCIRLLIYWPMLRRFRHQCQGTRLLAELRQPTIFIYKNINNHHSTESAKPTNNLYNDVLG
mgnify:CR=1 FL=1